MYDRQGRRRAHMILDHEKVTDSIEWDSLPLVEVVWRVPSEEERKAAAPWLSRKMAEKLRV